MKGEKKMYKKSKVLALLLCFALLAVAMPLMAFAEVTEQNPIAITQIEIGEYSEDSDLLEVDVTYEVYDGFGEQITILATTAAEVVTTGDTNKPIVKTF